MKASVAAAAIFACVAPALAAPGDNRWIAIEAFNAATDESLGYLWSEPIEVQYPDPVYGDESFDLMFAKMSQNMKKVQVIDDPEGSTAVMGCARTGPSPCWGSGFFDVGGGEWEAGHYLVRAGFRYADTPGYTPDTGFTVDNYNNATGAVDFKYIGPNKPYAFYGKFLWDCLDLASLLPGADLDSVCTACGSLPATEDDEPKGDLYIKYASEPTPAECQDIRLQMTFEAGKGSINWEKSYECIVYGHGMC